MTLSSGPFVSDGAAAILQVLSAEKNDSLAKLEDEVLNLKDENIKLEQRIDELQTELENERRCRAEVNKVLTIPDSCASTLGITLHAYLYCQGRFLSNSIGDSHAT